MSIGVGDALTGGQRSRRSGSTDTAEAPSADAARHLRAGEEHPLSLGQEQIWLHSQLVADPSAHTEIFPIAHRGPLETEALRAALTEVIRRHESWRTTFSEVDGAPIAFVHDAQEVELSVVDLRALPAKARDAELRRMTSDAVALPFDLGQGPLCRFRLSVLDDDLQRLDVTVHQIIVDRASIYDVLLPELAATYDDLVSSGSLGLPDPPMQYREYVRRQRDVSQDEVVREQLSYWQDTLAESLPALDLPTDRPRPAVQPDAGEEVSFIVPEGLSDALRAFSAREAVTLFDTLLTSFAVLLSRRTGDELQTIGTVTSARKAPELERLLGFFQNTIALRVDVSGDPTFREAVHRTSAVVACGLSNDGVPIHQVVQALSFQRDASRNPLFQAMLVLDPPAPEPPPGWEVDSQPSVAGRSWVDVHIELEDRTEGLIGRLRYPAALFDRSTAEALVHQWLIVMGAALAGPDRPIGDLPLLTHGEREALHQARNRVRPTVPFDPFTPDQLEQSIGSRFASQVAAFGDRPAVIDSDGQWTYRELDTAAGGVASAIVAAIPGSRPKVGVLGHPDARLIAAILGILKAGGAYVPLDPQSPPRRIAFIAEDAGLDLILVGDGLARLAREALGDTIPILAINAREGSAATTDLGDPDAPAWLLYTSGSTGQPKGVIQSHRNVLHGIRVYTNALHLNATDRLLLVAKTTFVASIYPMFGALLNGGALCVVDLTNVGFDGLRDAIVDRRITVSHTVPTVYRELVATLGSGERLDGIRAVMLGGEEVRSADLDAFRDHFARDAVFVNAMGSTESSMALQFFADAGTTMHRANVPVGYPVESTEVLLLDRYGRPSDFIGDIAIRSRFVARGYWNRPEQAAAFNPDPSDPGLITYRTGDRARRLADGSIEFLGRRDGQVKIRGMRVEIAEVERALAALPSVGQVAVEARAIDGRPELVGYVEPAGSERPSQHEMRVALRQELPEYMIPSTIVWLDRLPRTSSDKIDRRALPTPTAATLDAPVVAPHDALEQHLVTIWEKVLSHRPVRIDDDFFDLGGHSLLAARLFDQIWRETGKRIPLSALLEGATIEHLAARLREPGEPEGSGIVTVQPGGTQPPLFVVPGAGSRVLYLRNIAKYLGPDQPVYALHQRPSSMTGDSQHRVEDLATRYVAAMRRIQRSGPYRLLGYSFGGAVAFEIAQQLSAAGQTVSYLALIDSRCPGHPLPARRSSVQTIARRVANQAVIVKRLGPSAGTQYLRVRTTLAVGNALGSVRDHLDRRLPGPLRPLLWRDRTPDGEREWMAADYAALASYRAAPYGGPMTFIEAQHKASSASGVELWRGWARLASGGLEVRRVPGNHLTALVEPLAGITVAVLAETLRRSDHVDAIEADASIHGLPNEQPVAAPVP